jgi:O-antigen/teichoic acid export membrane protein
MSAPSEQALPGWPRDNVSTASKILTPENTGAAVLTGSVIMLAGSAFVSLANFGYNIGVAHLLGPGDFSHAAAAVTLLMLASCINLAFQLVSAKLIARTDSAAGKAAIYQSLMKRAWMVGAGLTVFMFALRVPLATYLRLPETRLIDVLALGMLFYIPLGVRRGAMQGLCQFVRLSANLTAEAVVKLIGAIAFIYMGTGVFGAVGAISLSVFIAFLLPAGDRELRKQTLGSFDSSFMEGMQAIIFFVGQVIINNVDILMVKHYFAAEDAGMYAAVALVGRLLYFATWSVTSAMFPVSAGARVEKESRRTLIVPLLFVVALSSIFVVFLAAFPNIVIRVLFGSGFHRVDVNMGQLLTMNAAATGIYALAVVLIAYEMSRRIANTGWFQLVVSVAVMGGVAIFHGSLLQVIVVQQVLRGILLIAVSIPFLFGHALHQPGEEAV